MNGGKSLPRGHNKRYDKAAQLEEENQRLRKQVGNTKFVSALMFFGFVILLASPWVPFYAIVMVFALGIIGLIALADRWNVREVKEPLQRLQLASLLHLKSHSKNEENETGTDEE